MCTLREFPFWLTTSVFHKGEVNRCQYIPQSLKLKQEMGLDISHHYAGKKTQSAFYFSA